MAAGLLPGRWVELGFGEYPDGRKEKK